MKKTLLFLASAGLILGLNHKAITSSSQPPTGHTGAPGQQTCATSGCHTGNLNTGSGSVELLNAPANYVPGTTYTMQIRVNLAGQSRAGFQMVALNSSNQQAGTFTLVSATNTALQTTGGKQYLSHNNANSNNTWSFNWVAPATNVGPVQFYFAGNAANNNNNTTGDFIYTGSKTLNPGSTTGVKEEITAKVNVFPNPASSQLNLDFTEKASNLKVLNIMGSEVLSQKNIGLKSQLDVSQFPNGTYFLQVEQNELLQLKRFVVQH